MFRQRERVVVIRSRLRLYHTSMARFYFNFRNGAEFIEDLEGIELADAASARARGAASLRDILAGDMLIGILNRASVIEIKDEYHRPVETVGVAQVLIER